MNNVMLLHQIVKKVFSIHLPLISAYRKRTRKRKVKFLWRRYIMFIGENLLNLRIMNGYSRRQLAEMIKVSEQAVWQYENDYTSPKLHSLNELKTIFNVKAPYFFNEDVLTRYATKEKIPLMNIAYRS